MALVSNSNGGGSRPTCTLHQNGVFISVHDMIYKHIIKPVTECFDSTLIRMLRNNS